MWWKRKDKETRINQIRDLEIVYNLLLHIARLSIFFKIPLTSSKIIDASVDIGKYIERLKKDSK